MIPPGWICPRRIGFLFPHPCDRLTPVGCPHCDNGQIEDPYASRNRGDYDDYDDYEDDASYLGPGLSTAAMEDFHEGDGEFLVKPEDDDYEDDLTES